MFGAHVTPETELIWEDLVQKHPKCLPFKNKGWQFWPKMKEIMGSPPPQGLRVFHTGQNSSAEQHERSQSLPWDIEQDGVPLPDDSQVCIYSFFNSFSYHCIRVKFPGQILHRCVAYSVHGQVD